MNQAFFLGTKRDESGMRICRTRKLAAASKNISRVSALECPRVPPSLSDGTTS